jgi:murein DD-endopeptidase MepM/ murein hydrolase activator NlpD
VRVATKYVTLLVVPHEDTDNPRRIRMPVWMFRALIAFAAAMILAPIIYVLLYFETVERAAKARQLAEENETLRKYQYRVSVLESELWETRQLVAQITEMVGLDSLMIAALYVNQELPVSDDHGRVFTGGLSRTLPPDSPIPDGMPATGWISRGYSDIPGKAHLGVDLAMPEGSPVFATAFGAVTFADFDDEYGYMIIMRNNDSIETVYGHNRENLVQVGDTVFAGQRIAHSGNTGKSSAPHLHYEIRIHGKAINPIKYFVYEDQTK